MLTHLTNHCCYVADASHIIKPIILFDISKSELGGSGKKRSPVTPTVPRTRERRSSSNLVLHQHYINTYWKYSEAGEKWSFFATLPAASPPKVGLGVSTELLALLLLLPSMAPFIWLSMQKSVFQVLLQWSHGRSGLALATRKYRAQPMMTL